MHKTNPFDGRLIHQLCKFHCKNGTTKQAEKLLKDTSPREKEYLLASTIEILIAKKEFSKAISRIEDNSETDEHVIGMKKKLYLLWARDQINEQECKKIALKGLDVKMSFELESNIPLMITNLRLAELCKDHIQFNNIIKRIQYFNPKIANELSQNDNKTNYWENDITVE